MEIKLTDLEKGEVLIQFNYLIAFIEDSPKFKANEALQVACKDLKDAKDTFITNLTV